MVGIGLLSGIVSGLGIGGGTILIPALILLYDLEQQTAQNINLIYFIPTALIALVSHMKQGNVEKKLVRPLVLYGIAGAIAGAFLAVRMESALLRKIFGGFLFAMGIYEFFKKKETEENREENSSMEKHAFEALCKQFQQASVEEKINLYVNAERLSQGEYRELLTMFPPSEIGRLEQALNTL